MVVAGQALVNDPVTIFYLSGGFLTPAQLTPLVVVVCLANVVANMHLRRCGGVRRW
jgi:hypothetical protein